VTADELSARLGLAELELELKGYPVAQAQTAVRRAAKLAAAGAERLRPEIQGAAMSDLLEDELAGAEGWLQGVRVAATRGDYREGVQRAARDGRYARGMERLLGGPTSRDAAWSESLTDAAAAWEGRS
jgi:hypothetical protein